MLAREKERERAPEKQRLDNNPPPPSCIEMVCCGRVAGGVSG